MGLGLTLQYFLVLATFSEFKCISLIFSPCIDKHYSLYSRKELVRDEPKFNKSVAFKGHKDSVSIDVKIIH